MVKTSWSLLHTVTEYTYISKFSNKLLCISNQVTEILKIRSNSKATGSFLKAFKKHWQIVEKIRLQKSFKF